MVAAILVTYNPDEILKSVIRSLASQVDHVLVIDNNSSDKSQLMAAIAGFDRVELLEQEQNHGLGTAYNKGIRHCIQLGYSEFLLSDQDSIFDAGFVEAMSAAQAVFPNALLGPMVIDRERSTPKKYEILSRWRFSRISIGGNPVPVTLLIGSGLFVQRTLFDRIGQFNERLFVDYVDTDYCLRARSHGVQCIVIPQARIFHQMGNCTDHTLFGIHFHPKNYSSFRKRIIYRNRACLWKSYPSVGLVLWDFSSILYDIALVCLFEKDKVNKFVQSVLGLVEGIAGNSH